MIKTITKLGDAQGIIFDAALLKLARLKVGDEVNVEVQPDGTITIAPVNCGGIEPATVAATAKRLINNNSELFRRLSK